MEAVKINLGKVSITVCRDYWNIDKEYDRLTIVERQSTHTCFLSRKPVPAGISIANREYWIQFSTWQDIPYEIVQEFGNSSELAISQKVLTQKFAEVEQDIANILNGTSDIMDRNIHLSQAQINTKLIEAANTVNSRIAAAIDAAADEEDLASVNVEGTYVLKFKDKVYNPLVYSGIGRKILRKNIVNDVNTLVQSMMQTSNTIYIIQYDFTLGEDITIPENCVLKFDGGSIIGNHTITGQNTMIDARLVKIFDTNISIVGSWNITEAYPEWFGAKGDGVTDDSIFIEKCINIFRLTCFSPEKTYFVNNTIVKTSSGNIDGKGCYLKASDNVEYIFDLATNNIDYGTKFIRNFNCYDTITGSSRYIFRINNIVGTIFENINIGSYSFGLCYIENNTWSLQFKNCNLNGYNTASIAVSVPANNQNSGERISFSNCTLGNYNTAIKISGTNLSFFFNNCSFDYNTNYILKEEGSNINSYSFVNCHFEANFTVEPFNTESLFTRVFINNCAIIFNKMYNGNFFYNCKASLENCYGNWANYISDKINANIHNVNSNNEDYYPCGINDILLVNSKLTNTNNVDFENIVLGGETPNNNVRYDSENHLIYVTPNGGKTGMGFEIPIGVHTIGYYIKMKRTQDSPSKFYVSSVSNVGNWQVVDKTPAVINDYNIVRGILSVNTGINNTTKKQWFSIWADGNGNTGDFIISYINVYKID